MQPSNTESSLKAVWNGMPGWMRYVSRQVWTPAVFQGLSVIALLLIWAEVVVGGKIRRVRWIGDDLLHGRDSCEISGSHHRRQSHKTKGGSRVRGEIRGTRNPVRPKSARTRLP